MLYRETGRLRDTSCPVRAGHRVREVVGTRSINVILRVRVKFDFTTSKAGDERVKIAAILDCLIFKFELWVHDEVNRDVIAFYAPFIGDGESNWIRTCNVLRVVSAFDDLNFSLEILAEVVRRRIHHRFRIEIITNGDRPR